MTTIAATATVTALTPPIVPRASARLALRVPAAAEAEAPSRVVAARRLAQRYRGTRGLAFVLSGLAGLGVLSLGALTSQIVGALDTTSLSAADRLVAGILLRIAPFVMLGGFAQILSAIAVLRDRPRAMTLGLSTALIGAATAVVGIVAIRLGAAPAAVTGSAASPATDIVNLLAWTLGLDVLAALAIRRIIRGRATA
jgi:hypothetical protein